MTGSPYQPYGPNPQVPPQFAGPYPYPGGPQDSFSQGAWAQPQGACPPTMVPYPVMVYPVANPVPHPRGATVLILSLCGLLFVPLSIIGLVIGSKARKEINQYPQSYAPSTALTIGWGLSAIWVSLYVIAIILMITGELLTAMA